MKYIPLHVHSHSSLLDGLSQCWQIVDRCKAIGADACALTDHGTLSEAVDFFQALKEAKIKPILGCELYISSLPSSDRSTDNRSLSHQVVLAKNLNGWRDLLELVTKSNSKENFYYKPRIDYDTLLEFGRRGNLLTFSGHPGSVLGNAITTDDNIHQEWRSIAKSKIRSMQAAFGENFFVEIQFVYAGHSPYCKDLALKLRDVAAELNVPTVATPDAHYATREQAVDQRVLLSSNIRKPMPSLLKDIAEGKSVGLDCFFKSDDFHIPTYDEMLDYGNTPEELANTIKMADMCEDYTILSNPSPPTFSCPNNMTEKDYLRKLCADGWKIKIANKINTQDPIYQTYAERVKYELSVFEEANLSGYFLIVEDILKFVKSLGYLVGPGRGSCAGSLVSYLIDITQIDPIPYELVFARFYNKARNAPGKVSLPDIDIDIPKEARPLVLKYLKQKYGEDHVGQIITFQKMKGRSAIKRVMYAHGGFSFEEQNAITEFIPDESKISDELQEMEEEDGDSSIILWSLQNNPDKFKEWCHIDADEEIVGPMATLFKQAIRLEGTKVASSRHAAGIIISNQPLQEKCPMVLDKEGENSLAGFEGPRCEESGLLKVDVLGIRLLDKLMEISKFNKTQG